MIQVPKERLARVEYLLEQSFRGNHVLFDPEDVRDVFASAVKRRFVLSEQQAYESEPLVERLLEESSLEASRAYLRGLDRPEFERVVLTYFSIVESALHDSNGASH